MSNEERHLYEFGPFRLDMSERLLSRDGAPVPMQPKALETLIVLVQRQGRLVEKGELMKTLWPQSFVEEANLNHHVWALRKTLGEGPNGQRYIETVPRRGYRFVAAVKELRDTDAEVVLEKHTFTRIVTEEAVEKDGGAEPRESISAALPVVSVAPRVRVSKSLKIVAVSLLVLGAAAFAYRAWVPRERGGFGPTRPGRPALRSIAVLPFKTIGTTGNDSDYLGLGVADALITRIGNSRRLVVRPTSAVRRYADPLQDPLAAGREQGVEAVLDGNVQRAGDRIRVTVQLFRAQDGALLWSATFDEQLTDIFAVQDSISQQVVRELLVELDPEERRRLEQRGTANVEAYQAYLKGLYFWNKREKDAYRKALEHFSQAIEIDPKYAQAYVGLGHAHAYLGGHDLASQNESMAKQRAAARKALELDESLAEAHTSLGLIAMNSDWNWVEAEREFKRAIELNPNYATAHAWYGEFLAFMGRFKEGEAEIRRGQELDPLSLSINTDVAKVYTLARRYDEAIAQYQKVLEMDPEFGAAHGLLAVSYSLKGEHAEAIGELQKIKDLESDPMLLSYLGYVYGRAGRKREAQEVLSQMKRLSQRTYVSPLWMTIAYAGVGENDRAFKWLERVFEERSVGGTIGLKVSPMLDSLRSDPRFATQMQRAGF